jgi:adenine-specific DNA-methyltransferase
MNILKDKPKCKMNYIGSKYKLLDFISNTILDVCGDISNSVFADVFGGTCIVGRYLKPLVKSVIVNDMEYYSYIFGRNYIVNNKIDCCSLIKELNNLSGIDGFVFRNYSENGGNDRLYYSEHNGKKIDAIRSQIEKWKLEKVINEDQYFCLLCSLLEASDKVANTTSVYGAYLKKIKKSAQKYIQLEHPDLQNSTSKNFAYNKDVNVLIRDIEGDILYLDPPYNQREYGSNYHLLNTIAKYDDFKPKGKTGLREYNVSSFCKKKNVASSLNNIIRNANFNHIFMSYNNEGLLSFSDIKDIMSQYGKYSLRKIKYTRYKADSERQCENNFTYEYLHILNREKNNVLFFNAHVDCGKLMYRISGRMAKRSKNKNLKKLISKQYIIDNGLNEFEYENVGFYMQKV